MRVDVFNRRQAEAEAPRAGVWVISIYTPGDEPAALKDGWDEVFRFRFSDIAGDCSEIRELRAWGHEVVLFDPRLAEEMLAVILAALNVGVDLMVHCDAGVSRSQAVARFIRHAFGVNVYSHTIWTDESSNRLVLKHLNRIMWERSPEGYVQPDRGELIWAGDESGDYEL